MKKRVLAMLLAAVMLIGLLAACGSSTTETETAQETEETTEVSEEASEEVSEEASEEAEEATEEETASEEPSEAAEEESGEAEEASEEPAEEAEATEEAEPAEEAEIVEAEVALPIVEEPVSYTMWTTLHPAYMNYVTDLAELTVWKEIAERTGISFEFTAVSGITASDSFSLMIVGGEYDDVITEMDLLSEGIESAIEQEIIQDISGLVEEYCPSYWSRVKADDTAYLTLVTDAGYVGTLATLRGETGSTDLNGPMVRGDWLDEFGMSDPETLEDLYAYLTQANETYGAVTEFSADGMDALLMSCYNLAEYTVEDGVVINGYTSDRFYEYLKTAAQWYAEGLIDPDFYSVQDTTENASKVANGQYSICSNGAQGIARVLQYVTDPSSTIRLHPIAYVTTEVSPEIYVGQENALITDKDAWAFSATCEDVTPLLTLVEYMCTEEGQLLFNYGVEGENYTLDENGDPQWTEFMTANEEYAFDVQEYLYATATLPGIRDFSREMYAYSDEELRAVEIFGSMNCSWNYPSYAVMTAEESSAYSAIEQDLSTYAESTVLAFITGQTTLDDAAWEEFQTTLSSMGIDDMTGYKQAAYDRAQEKLDNLG